MEPIESIREKLAEPKGSAAFENWYENPAAQPQRYLEAVRCFEKAFGTGRRAALFSSPGRCEIIGNHTDHQFGRAVAAAVTLDMIAVAAPNGSHTVRVVSEGYSAAVVELDDLAPRIREKGMPSALIRGTAAGLTRAGFSPAGFDAYVSSHLPSGAGLSSSASLECLIGAIFNVFFCGGKASAVQIAQAGRFAESEYFGKPCGLMDQLACATGGFAAMDFAEPAAPQVRRQTFSPRQHGLCLFSVHTGGSHADLTGQYAAIPAEMKEVAACFDRQVLRQVPEDLFWARMGELRGRVCDGRFCAPLTFLKRIAAPPPSRTRWRKTISRRSYRFLPRPAALPNSFCKMPGRTPSPENEAFAWHWLYPAIFCRTKAPAGSTAADLPGSILSFVPQEMADFYRQRMEAVFGLGSCRQLYIRPAGAGEILL